MRSATSVMVGAANGCRPTVSSYRITPSDQMSERASQSRAERSASGDM